MDMVKPTDSFKVGYTSGHKIWSNGFNYFITVADHSKKSRNYDELWYCRRAIDQNNIEWLEENNKETEKEILARIKVIGKEIMHIDYDLTLGNCGKDGINKRSALSLELEMLAVRLNDEC